MVNFSSGAVHVNEKVLEPRSGSSDRKGGTGRSRHRGSSPGLRDKWAQLDWVPELSFVSP